MLGIVVSFFSQSMQDTKRQRQDPTTIHAVSKTQAELLDTRHR